jgi:hypothetical protein
VIRRPSGCTTVPPGARLQWLGQESDPRLLSLHSDSLMRLVCAVSSTQTAARNVDRGRYDRAPSTSAVRTFSRPRPPSRYSRTLAPSQEISAKSRPSTELFAKVPDGGRLDVDIATDPRQVVPALEASTVPWECALRSAMDSNSLPAQRSRSGGLKGAMMP